MTVCHTAVLSTAVLLAACVGRPCCPPDPCPRALPGPAAGPVGAVRVQVAVVRDVDEVRASLERATGPWVVSEGEEVNYVRPVVRTGSIVAEAWRAALAGHVIADLTFDATSGRVTGAKKTVVSSYVQDFDLEIDMGGARLTDANVILGAIEEGITASVDVGGAGEDGLVACDVAWIELLRPIPTFETTGPGFSNAKVTIELPEMRFRRSLLRLPAREGGASISSHAGGVGFCARIGRTDPAPSAPALRAEHLRTERLRIEARVRRRTGSGPWATEVIPAVVVPEAKVATIRVADSASGLEALLGRKPSEKVGPDQPGTPLPEPGIDLKILPAPAHGSTRSLDVILRLVRLEGEPRVMPTVGAARVKLPTLVLADLPWRLTLREGEEGVESTVLRRATGDETSELTLKWSHVSSENRAAGSAPVHSSPSEGTTPK